MKCQLSFCFCKPVFASNLATSCPSYHLIILSYITHHSDHLGRRPLQAANVLLGGVPDGAAAVPLRAAALSPERLSLWHRLSVDSGRGEGLAPLAQRQAGAAGHSGAARRPQPTRSRPGRGLQHLSVTLTLDAIFRFKFLPK